MKVRRIWSTEIYIESNGDITRKANTDTSDDTFYFLYTYSNGYWKIIDSKYENEL